MWARVRGWSLALLVGAGVVYSSVSAADENADARAHALSEYQKGIAALDAGDALRALQYFETSRSTFRSWQNTLNCAVALTRLGREADAAARLEEVLTFDDLPVERRGAVQTELTRLLGRLGALEVHVRPGGSTVSVDGKNLAQDALGRPLRVGTGAHQVRAFKQGYEPVEREVLVERGETARLELELPRLASVAELAVREGQGRQLDVLVDGDRVGTTPWSGLIAPGTHAVQLTGSDSGTVPMTVMLRGGRGTALRLDAVATPCRLSVSATPRSAELLLNGVVIGRGSWSSALPCRNYEVVARAADRLTARRSVALESNASVKLELDRVRVQVEAPNWELDAKLGVGLGPGLGGDLDKTCTATCSRDLPRGGRVAISGLLRTPSGLGFGLEASGNMFRASYRDRNLDQVRDGPTPTTAVVDDETALYALGFGPRLSYAWGRSWVFESALGAGVWLGYVRLSRSGSVNSPPSPLATKRFDSSLVCAAIEPEGRLGRAFGRWRVGLSLSLPMLIPLSAPTTEGFTQRAGQVTASYAPGETLTGSVFWFASAGVWLRRSL